MLARSRSFHKFTNLILTSTVLHTFPITASQSELHSRSIFHHDVANNPLSSMAFSRCTTIPIPVTKIHPPKHAPFCPLTPLNTSQSHGHVAVILVRVPCTGTALAIFLRRYQILKTSLHLGSSLIKILIIEKPNQVKIWQRQDAQTHRARRGGRLGALRTQCLPETSQTHYSS